LYFDCFIGLTGKASGLQKVQITCLIMSTEFYSGDQSYSRKSRKIDQFKKLKEKSVLMLLIWWREGHLACKNSCFKTLWDDS